MRAHKFLAPGAVGPLSGFAWPAPSGSAPGPWVEVEGPLALCAHGIHVCRSSDLAHWIHEELWELEVAGDAMEGVDCVIVPRARLVRRIDAWSGLASRGFVDRCIEHAAAQVGAAPAGAVRDLLDDARFMSEHGYVALGAFTAAVAVSRADAAGTIDVVYRRERAWQSACIAREFLATTPDRENV